MFDALPPPPGPYHNFLVQEAIAKRFREIHQQEADRQSLRYADSQDEFPNYDDMPENFKEFYRVLARYVLDRLSNSVKALQYYADEKNWLELMDNGGDMRVLGKNAYDDMGHIARKVLEEMGFKNDV